MFTMGVGTLLQQAQNDYAAEMRQRTADQIQRQSNDAILANPDMIIQLAQLEQEAKLNKSMQSIAASKIDTQKNQGLLDTNYVPKYVENALAQLGSSTLGYQAKDVLSNAVIAHPEEYDRAYAAGLGLDAERALAQAIPFAWQNKNQGVVEDATSSEFAATTARNRADADKSRVDLGRTSRLGTDYFDADYTNTMAKLSADTSTANVTFLDNKIILDDPQLREKVYQVKMNAAIAQGEADIAAAVRAKKETDLELENWGTIAQGLMDSYGAEAAKAYLDLMKTNITIDDTRFYKNEIQAPAQVQKKYEQLLATSNAVATYNDAELAKKGIYKNYKYTEDGMKWVEESVPVLVAQAMGYMWNEDTSSYVSASGKPMTDKDANKYKYLVNKASALASDGVKPSDLVPTAQRAWDTEEQEYARQQQFAAEQKAAMQAAQRQAKQDPAALARAAQYSGFGILPVTQPTTSTTRAPQGLGIGTGSRVAPVRSPGTSPGSGLGAINR